jgi:hypothetical protein
VQLKASLELENAPTTRREGLQTMSSVYNITRHRELNNYQFANHVLGQ